MKEPVDYPLGKILHIIDNEAICRPGKAFVAKGARVMTIDQKKIGRLGDPFGPVKQPYQPIILDKGVGKDVIGKLALAQYRPRKQKRRKKR